jgi:hypothetical protein
MSRVIVDRSSLFEWLVVRLGPRVSSRMSWRRSSMMRRLKVPVFSPSTAKAHFGRGRGALRDPACRAQL